MPNTELAEELLQLEEADAWFEYLESTRGQTQNAVRRGRAVGVGTPLPAPAWRASATRSPSPCGGLSSALTVRARGAGRRGCYRSAGHVDRCLEPTQREAGNAGGFPGPARDRKRRIQPWHYAGFALARRKRNEAAAREAVAVEVQAPPETQAPEPTEAQDAPRARGRGAAAEVAAGAAERSPELHKLPDETSEEPDDAASDSARAGSGSQRRADDRAERPSARPTNGHSAAAVDGRRRSEPPCRRRSGSCSSRSTSASSESRSSRTTASPRSTWSDLSGGRSPGTSTSASSTTSFRGWRRRSSRSGSRRTDSCTWTRSSARSSRAARAHARSRI